MSNSLDSPRSDSRSRVGKWVLRALFAIAVVLGVAAIASALLVKHVSDAFSDNLTRDTDVVQVLTPTTDPHSVDTGGTQQEPAKTFLIIGSDSREGVTDALGTNFGDFPGQRADVIILLKVYPSDDRVQVLSIPRDLRVDIDGHGTNKINASFAFGGSELMVRTVRQVTGLDINHYMEVNFVGFAAIVDELGGVQLSFPYPARDLKSGFSVDAGTQTLDGATALAYARSRHYQELVDGSWKSVDASDIGRTRRQQQLILAILAEMKRPSTITAATSLTQTIASHLTVDSTLTENEIVGLAWSLRSINGSTIESATLPTYSKTIDGVSYQIQKEPEASTMLGAFAVGDPLAVDTTDVIRVQVLNGNGVAGAAGTMADRLNGNGIEVTDVGDAKRDDFATTQIIAAPDNLALARAVAEKAGVGEAVPGTVPSSVDVIVIVGRDAQA